MQHDDRTPTPRAIAARAGHARPEIALGALLLALLLLLL